MLSTCSSYEDNIFHCNCIINFVGRIFPFSLVPRHPLHEIQGIHKISVQLIPAFLFKKKTRRSPFYMIVRSSLFTEDAWLGLDVDLLNILFPKWPVCWEHWILRKGTISKVTVCECMFISCIIQNKANYKTPCYSLFFLSSSIVMLWGQFWLFYVIV